MKKAIPRAPGRPKDPEKRTAILTAAGCQFLEHGYDRTTMDAIAAEAGVSKLTVYSHFADKESLFKALINSKCEQHFGGHTFMHLAGLDPEKALTTVANGFLGLMFSPEVIALHRMLIAGAAHEAALNQTFYDMGPGPGHDAVAELLAAYVKQGKLRIAKPRLAADHFLAMLRGDLHLRVLLNIDPAPTPQQLKAYIKDGVDVFLRAYAVGGH